ncbi:hypothetical protein OSB04_013249 [Centaurea solstitialis]|uniref:F-box domain-containing protein n=1 Tax=Centaurea solstitialis TaxID=347529 RepID=A0AA38WN70_9ASTR|nr:hypothetical protein OSB04_013249 [Centaurea solstitialis]
MEIKDEEDRGRVAEEIQGASLEVGRDDHCSTENPKKLPTLPSENGNSVLVFFNLLTENHESRFVTCTKEDRISNLPEHLIGSILKQLPVQDAARMSILSRQWRYIWTTMTALVLNYQFSKRFAKEGASGRNEFIRIVNDIIIRRNGPITNFSLHIPEEIDSLQEVDQWILFFSRNSGREHTFTKSNQPYELPNDVFSCSKLTTLQLKNCIFMPPLQFEGFPNLYDLSLKNIDFRANSCGTVVSLPRLRKLSLFECKNLFNFNIKARILEELVVSTCFDAILLRLMESPCLSMVSIYFWKPVEDYVQLEGVNLSRMLSILPKLRCLVIDGHFLKFLCADQVPKWLPGAINSLRSLLLPNFQLSDLDQLHGILCLLRNSPNLLSLRMNHVVSKEYYLFLLIHTYGTRVGH